MTKIELLIASGQKVFNTQDLSVIWGISSKRRLLEEVKYYVRVGRLIRVYCGIYALSKDLKNLQNQLIQKLVPFSYISLSTALSGYGIIFQYEKASHAIALISKKFKIGVYEIYYHKMKESVFFNEEGLIKENNFILASRERAVCDTLYLYPGYGFDNLRDVDRKLLIETALIYKNKRLEKEIKRLG